MKEIMQRALQEMLRIEERIGEPVILRLHTDGSADLVKFLTRSGGEPLAGFDSFDELLGWLFADERTRAEMNRLRARQEAPARAAIDAYIALLQREAHHGAD